MPTDDAVNSVRFRGDLEKQGRFSTWSWKCYWFMLDDDQLCYFHQEKQQTRAQGLIDLSQAKKVCICPTVNHGFAFEIVSANRRHVLSASTAELREKWMKNLHVAMCLRRRRSSVMFTASCNTISDAGSSDDEDEMEKTPPKKGSRLVNIFSKKPSTDKRATIGGTTIEVPVLDEPPPPASGVVMRKKNLSESDLPKPVNAAVHVHAKSSPDFDTSGATEWPMRKKRTDSMNNYLDTSEYRDMNLTPTLNPVADNGETNKDDTEESEFLRMVKAANPVDMRSSRIDVEAAGPSLMARSFSKQYSHGQRHTMPGDPGSSSTHIERSVSRQAASCGYKSDELKRCGSDSSLNNFLFDDDDSLSEEEEETEDDVFKSDPVEMRPKKADEVKEEYFRHSLPPMTELKGLDPTNHTHTRHSLMPLMEMSESVSSESQEESSRQGSRGSSQRGSVHLPSRQGSQGSVISTSGATAPVAGSAAEEPDSTDGIVVDFPPIPELPNPRQELTWESPSDQIREFIAQNRGPRELYLPPESSELSGKAMENLTMFLKALESDA